MKLICAGLFVLLTSVNVFGQKNVQADTTSADDSKFSILQAGISYGNTANYYGQTTAQKLPYTSVDLSYKAKNGLWGAASATKLLNVGTGSTELDLAAGYDFDLTKKLGGSVSYTRFFFAKNSPLPQSVNPNTLSAGLAYDFKWLNSSLFGDYVFGNLKDNQGNLVRDFYLSWSTSKSIDLGSILSKKDWLTVDPSFSVIGGTQQVTEEVPLRKNVVNLPGIKKKPRTAVVTKTEFSVITSVIKLPLSYNRPHYTIQGAYQLSLPNKGTSSLSSDSQSYFTLSFTYLFYKDK